MKTTRTLLKFYQPFDKFIVKPILSLRFFRTINIINCFFHGDHFLISLFFHVCPFIFNPVNKSSQETESKLLIPKLNMASHIFLKTYFADFHCIKHCFDRIIYFHVILWAIRYVIIYESLNIIHIGLTFFSVKAK